MKKTQLLLLILSLSLSFTSRANPIEMNINGVKLDFVQGATLPESMNEHLLKGVYCGLPSDLKDETLTVTDCKQTDKYTVAVFNADGDYYAVTYNTKGGIIDGLLLLKRDDIAMGCDFTNPRGNQMDALEPSLTLEPGMVSVTRNFVTHVNVLDNGGPIITEEGSVTSVFNIDTEGKFTASKGSQHSKMIIADNPSVPGSRGMKNTSESDKCNTLFDSGMQILSFLSTPLSQESNKTVTRLEELYNKFNVFLCAKKVDHVSIIACLVELESLQKGMILRNPKLWLESLDNVTEDSRVMAALNNALSDDTDFKAELLKEVKALKDKKLRKVWEPRLK